MNQYASVGLPERFSPVLTEQKIASSVPNRFPEYRPDLVLLPESFCIPLRRRCMQRSLPNPSSDYIPLILKIYGTAGNTDRTQSAAIPLDVLSTTLL